MAFIGLEDLVGTVEVIVWPGDYEKNASYLEEDSKVFIQGHVSVEEEKNAKLICEKIIPFSQIPKKLWIRFASKEDYEAREQELKDALADSDGIDKVAIYLKDSKKIKNLSQAYSVHADDALLAKLAELFGEDNVKIG